MVEQSPDPNNRVTLSSVKDALGLPRPQIAYNISDYTKQGIVAAFRLKKLIFGKLGATDFTNVGRQDPAGFDEMIDGKHGTPHLRRRRSRHGHLSHGRRPEDIGGRLVSALA